MKKLLVLSILSGVTVVTSGCFHCFQKTQSARQCVPAAAPCCAPNPCDGSGMMTSVPSLTVPSGTAVQVMPGPEAYSSP
jgi:hypothetical protein